MNAPDSAGDDHCVPEDMRIILTSEALAQAEQLRLAQVANGGPEALRIYIEGKGCDGFYYGVTFDAPEPNDMTYTLGSQRIVIDEESLRYMHGATVEWVDDERGRGFLVENPNHRRFRGKFFKRASWMKTFTEKSDAAT